MDRAVGRAVDHAADEAAVVVRAAASEVVEAVGGLDAVATIALGLGLVWLYVNCYSYLPVYARLVRRFLGRGGPTRLYTEGTALPDDELPTIDVLVPAYDEDETIGYAIRQLRRVDYPDAKFAVHVVVEAGDLATRRELARLRGQVAFQELVVPSTYPGRNTKPRALDYAVEHTDGDIVGILDAEDIVDPDLFRQAVRALVDDGHDYVQGRLDMLNEDDGLLNTLFRGEYGFWYHVVLPSYFAAGYPVPLGGTTNFFHRSVLESVAERRLERFGSPWRAAAAAGLADSGLSGAVPWDPRNVTEDFELGLLLWEADYDMAMMAATTREESPVGANAWVRQRTRWQKGKLFTFYQRLKHPPRGLRRKLHVYSQSALPHLGPINVVGVLLVAGYGNLVGFDASPFLAAVLLLGLLFVGQHMAIQAVGYWITTDRRGLTRLRRTLSNFLGVPLLWLLLWGSDIRAMIQLAFEPHSWEKTHHTGRHIDRDANGTPTDAGAGGVGVEVEPAAGGWRWRLTDRTGRVLARGERVLDSEAAARDAGGSVAATLATALGDGTRFHVAGPNGSWSWVLRDADGELALAGDDHVMADAAAARDAAERARTLAGTARVRRPSEDPSG